MSEMVDRVARAIASVSVRVDHGYTGASYIVYEDGRTSSLMDHKEALRILPECQSRAAINAMREPSEPMMYAAGEVIFPHRQTWDVVAKLWYQTMIEAAINPPAIPTEDDDETD